MATATQQLYIQREKDVPVWQILEHLQRNQSATIKEIEHLLGVTTNAVRQHLSTLLSEGYVERQRVNSGVGRPHHIYILADKARKLFACHCDDLALMMLEEVFALEGREQAMLILQRVGQRLAKKYADVTQNIAPAKRIHELAEAMSNSGVLTEVVAQDDGSAVLKTYNCPYHELAQEHREICEMDRGMISTVLGSEVNLGDCIMDGHAGCSFVVNRNNDS